ncbi:unnamed protein product [Linum tenue]|uniref:Uncharacterized protein n=1 Tax=Linum tenue TaxID=586396 RepID=A0AAV0JC49_9ROSI|nr:unnamed protein product [Linum tenue]
MAAVDESSSTISTTVHHNVDPPSSCDGEAREGTTLATCDAMEGHCFNADRDDSMMDMESHDRLLWEMGPERQRYITYEALRANSIPCGWRGNSYYDCDAHKRVNPYRRGCTAATRCFRYTH